MRAFGETAGEAFKFIAKAAYAAYIGIQEFILALTRRQLRLTKSLPGGRRLPALPA
jgi:hypothetical protein